MSDSNITKRALAAALRELMEAEPFDKIQIAQICQRCDMNRKSFYYHFRDKYDLMNWIFDMDFDAFTKESVSVLRPDDRWELIEHICEYFYENRNFYRRALQVKGQNSFSDHLREYCRPLLQARISTLTDNGAVDGFVVDFFSDALVCAVERWLLDKECVPPEQFVSRIKQIIQNGAKALYQESQQETQQI